MQVTDRFEPLSKNFDEIEAALAKGPRRGPKPADGSADGEGGEREDQDQEAVVEDEAA